ncbi:hypothetical protein BDN72DRAFT_861324 [Pluteus cervinus]|uniref:Uncharacterized protein n=1 Tax=Pluteus cervinus TaxID=181527 RepID=A0ACD3AGC5_9AGAR|nr:hypothetical protein BDN72DRAFT_861324 [Pluteus cervinus]
MSNTTDCDFSSLNAVLQQATASGTNITELVQECQGICNLAWGNGNPDLSGIGANVSYIIQFLLVVIFGPIFVLFHGLKDRNDDSESKFVELHKDFVNASAQFTIPITIATVVRIKQDASLYEITFLQYLTSMQFLGLLAVHVAGGVVKKPGVKQITLMVLYSLLDFGLYMGLVGFLQTSKASWTQIQELGSACIGYGKILPGYNYAKSAHLQAIASTTLDIFAFPRDEPVEGFIIRRNAAEAGKKIELIFGLALAGVAGVVALGFTLFGLYMTFTKKWHIPLGVISLGLTSGTLYFLVQMELTRGVMQSLTGTEFLDNQWGFGQVLSLLLWIPFLVQGLWSLLRPLRKASQKNSRLKGNTDTKFNIRSTAQSSWAAAQLVLQSTRWAKSFWFRTVTVCEFPLYKFLEHPQALEVAISGRTMDVFAGAVTTPTCQKTRVLLDMRHSSRENDNYRPFVSSQYTRQKVYPSFSRMLSHWICSGDAIFLPAPPSWNHGILADFDEARIGIEPGAKKNTVIRTVQRPVRIPICLGRPQVPTLRPI